MDKVDFTLEDIYYNKVLTKRDIKQIFNRVIYKIFKLFLKLKKLKILHTDVKLENIGINISMLSVKLLDFGLSVSYEDILTIERKCSGTSFFHV